MPLTQDAYSIRVQAILQSLGIPGDMVRARSFAMHHEPPELVTVPCHPAPKDADTVYLLTPASCKAWLRMQEAARAQGIPLALVSAYRSVERQREIIAAKLALGQTITEILTSVAPPGYSEHHTGRAIDIGTSEEAALEEVFETTDSYQWLNQHARSFGFVMSYPRNNPEGFVFEPWHWCYQAA